MKKFLFWLVFLSICSACGDETRSNQGEQKERPHDPWVFRSVLDQMPRMITAAIDSNLWVAYHVQHGALYKYWDGGVTFEGAVYDYAHGPQPSSYGYSYTVNKFESPWFLIKDGNEVSLTTKYTGHSFKGSSLFLHYELSGPDLGTTIRITENPEVKETEGNKSFVRVFESDDIPSGTTLGLKTNISSLIFDSDFNTDGEWKEDSKNTFQFEGTDYFEVEGALLLNSGKTELAVVLNKAVIADENKVEAALVSNSDVHPGLKLIAKNDCKTCHNKKVKTIGPAYIAIAKKYKETKDNIALLSSKVKKGGSGIWGSQVMNAHEALADSDIKEMVNYILSLSDPDDYKPDDAVEALRFSALTEVNEDNLVPGALTKTWSISGNKTKFPTSILDNDSKYAGILSNFDNLSGSDFKGHEDNFALSASGYLYIEESKEIAFRIWSDDGSLLYFHGQKVIDNDGLHGTQNREATIYMEKGYHPFRLDFYQGLGGKFLSFNYKPKDAEQWAVIPTAHFFHDKDDQAVLTDKSLPMSMVTRIPGNEYPLTEMHPSFKVKQAKPSDFEPKVGGLDFLSDGTAVISTWDPTGSVYLLKNTEGPEEDIVVKKIASGFAEPLGLKVVDDVIYIMQKQELTKLIDNDGDEVIDEFITLCDDWGVTANFHEFGFGLDYKDGYFYATLATGILPGGASMPNQHPNRGSAVKIAKDGSSIEFIANGLRTPNGIGLGYNDEIFVADNQGDWLPASKIVHVTEGDWFGSRSVDFKGTADKEEKPPLVWLPQDEIGNSPSTPSYLNIGPYKNQMIHGEVTHGGVKRVFVEEVNGVLQGAVFRFMQGLDAGINRIRWAPDGSLYAGGIGNPGNWGQTGKQWFGLNRIDYTGEPTFEMLSVKALTNGMEIEFTEPLKEGEGWNQNSYLVKQWYYEPTINYGGPKLDEKELKILSVNIDESRRKVFLELDGMKKGHVVYIQLKERFVSASNLELWSTECWYTLNEIPSNKMGFKSVAPAVLANNQLSELEKAEGWELLFDGKSMDNFRNFKKQTIGSSWVIEDGAIHLAAVKEDGKWQAKDGGDIITKEQYENFDLRLEWKISNCGNSGIFWNVVETDFDYGWQTGPEMQILDNVCHPDTKYPTHRAGDLYDMIECKYVAVKPAGEWNKVGIISNNGEVEFWMNGTKVVDFTMFNDEWQSLIDNSKFKGWNGFGAASSGHISLQDHGDKVWFRNIKIKEL